MIKTIFQVQPQAAFGEDWTRLAVEHGLAYEVLELSMPNTLDNAQTRAARTEWYWRSGRCVSLHGAFIDVNPASGDAQIAKLSVMRLRQSCESAREIGCRHVVFHASAHPFLNDAYLENWAHKCARVYDDLAEEFDLEIHIENSMDAYPDALALLMMRKKSSKVSCCLDIGHAQYSKTPVSEWFRVLGTSIRYLHLSDNMGVYDDHLAIGDGEINWFAVDRAWRAIGAPPLMTLETGGLEDVERSIHYLRSNRLMGME